MHGALNTPVSLSRSTFANGANRFVPVKIIQTVATEGFIEHC
jgi:hypothetical protein